MLKESKKSRDTFPFLIGKVLTVFVPLRKQIRLDSNIEFPFLIGKVLTVQYVCRIHS